MKIENCPKKLHHCQNTCPEFPCWAYEEHLTKKDIENKKRNEGWE